VPFIKLIYCKNIFSIFFFVGELKNMLLDKRGDFFVSITKGTSGKWAKDTRFREMRSLIQKTLEYHQV
jgi:hypothetical protein